MILLINENCSKITDFIATTFVRSSCSSDWRFEILSWDIVASLVSCVTGKKASGLWGGSAIILVSVIKNESAPLIFLKLISLPSSSSCKISFWKYCTGSYFSFSIPTRCLWILFVSGPLVERIWVIVSKIFCYDKLGSFQLIPYTPSCQC